MFKKRQYRVKLKGSSTIEYTEGDKKISIGIEFLAGKAGIVAYFKNIHKWTSPLGEALPETTRQEIKQRISQELNKHKIPVTWDQ